MRVFRWNVCLLLLFTAAAWAQGGVPGIQLGTREDTSLIEAKAIARRFLEMDAQGFRLDNATAKRMLPLTTWTSFPNFRTFYVLAGYEIVTARNNAAGVLVTVEYNVMGRFEKGVGYSHGPHLITVQLQMVENNGIWKILLPEAPSEDERAQRRQSASATASRAAQWTATAEELSTPHVLRGRTVRWLREQVAKPENAESKQAMETALKQLE